MDNIRGIPREPAKPRDAVETTRAASVDWSHLREDYDRIGNLTRLAREYGKSYYTVRAELERQGIPIKPRGHVKGQKKSAAWRKASAKHWDDPAWREKQRQNWLERAPSMRGYAANSPLEKKLHTALLKAGISFSTQRKHCGKYLVDIQVEQAPVVIEADGALHVRNKDADAQRDKEIEATGYRVFRFTGTQINADPNLCIQKVIDACGLVPESEPRADIRNGGRGEDSPSWTGGKQEYTCERPECGKTFLAWNSMRKKDGRSDHVFCSNECQRLWQIENPPRTWTQEDRVEHSSRMRELWADPVWRANTLARRAEAKRQKQMKI